MTVSVTDRVIDAYLRNLLLKGQHHACPAVGEGSTVTGNSLQPANDQRGGHVEWQIADDVQIRRLCKCKGGISGFICHKLKSLDASVNLQICK